MNPEELIKMARDIYVRMVVGSPTSWDKQKMARTAIEAAKQFFLALQSEKEGSAWPSAELPLTNQPPATPTESSEPPHSPHWVTQAQGAHTTKDNLQAAGRGMVLQRHLGQGMG